MLWKRNYHIKWYYHWSNKFVLKIKKKNPYFLNKYACKHNVRAIWSQYLMIVNIISSSVTDKTYVFALELSERWKNMLIRKPIRDITNEMFKTFMFFIWQFSSKCSIPFTRLIFFYTIVIKVETFKRSAKGGKKKLKKTTCK